MPKVRGKVCRLPKGKEFCFVEPLDSMPEGFALPRGGQILLHQNNNGGQLPRLGDVGNFMVENSPKGVKATAVDWEQSSTRGNSNIERFVHVYNFVTVPPGGLGDAATVPPFERGPSAPHDRYDHDRRSGYFECSLTTKTHWFIPDPRKARPSNPKPKDHTLGYFTLEEATKWNASKPVEDTTTPAIPAASIRGMVRSIFETITLSCFSVFDPAPLDLRIGYMPDYKGPKKNPFVLPSGRGEPAYIPCRVLSVAPEGAIQLLDGAASGDPDPMVGAAWVPAYEPNVCRGKQKGKEADPWEILAAKGVKDGGRVAAVIERTPTGHGEFHYRRVAQAVPARCVEELRAHLKQLLSPLSPPCKDRLIAFGYLHRTGPNFPRKHDERLFYRWDDTLDPVTVAIAATEPEGADEYEVLEAEIVKSYGTFLAADQPQAQVGPDVIEKTVAGLAGYADRHGKNASTPAPPRRITADGKVPFLSDFVRERPEQVKANSLVGALFYALLEKANAAARDVVHGLYPVCIPRLSHDDSRGALLPIDFQPCDDRAKLCAGCRVFGWVRAAGETARPAEGASQPPAGERRDAVAGHVRFTHAVLAGEWTEEWRRQVLPVPLAILATPHPTTTEFYLRERTGSATARSSRWPPVLSRISGPLYRSEEATLRGRKLYRRRRAVDPRSDDPASNGIQRRGQPDHQSQTVHLLPPGLRFRFRVFFDNLTPGELGALELALGLQVSDVWKDVADQGELQHALGRGKPLGMGGCEIRIDDLIVDCFNREDPDHRYAQPPSFVGLGSLETAPARRTKPPTFIASFADAWSEAESANHQLGSVREELVELLRALPSEVPVHYPPHPDGGHDNNYQWFVDNRWGRQGLTPLNVGLPNPCKESMDGSARLPRKPTRKDAKRRAPGGAPPVHRPGHPRRRT